MDSNAGITAAQWRATVDEKHLVKILFEYGEERFARRIAGAILEKREALPKMLIKKFDPKARKHVDYKEMKLK